MASSIVKDLLPVVSKDDKYVGLARRADIEVKVNGLSITKEIKADLIDIDITDNEEDECDDLQITLHDRDGVWLKKWLNDTIQTGAKTKGLKFTITIGAVSSDGKISQQKAGTFYLDSIKHSGPPSRVVMKCCSCDFKGGIRTESRDKAWAKTTLKNIATKIAKAGGLKLSYLPKKVVRYPRQEQNDETDLHFLKNLCQQAGFAMKITDEKLVIFDKAEFETKNSVKTIRSGNGQYTKWELNTSTGDTAYDICEVVYTNPSTGKAIKGTAKSADYDTSKGASHMKLTIKNVKVANKKEAVALAKQMLKLKNDFERIASFTMPGNPEIMAGQCITLKDFGYWDGKYMVRQVIHNISNSGYTSNVHLRFIS